MKLSLNKGIAINNCVYDGIIEELKELVMHFHGRIFILAILIFLPTLLLCNEPGKIILVSDGKSPYRIVVSSRAMQDDRAAASVLQYYLDRISGVKMPIVESDTIKSGYVIWMGSAINCQSVPIPVEWKKLDDDGFTIKTLYHTLVIAGGKQKGLLYGAYSFLEKYLGCRKYSPTVEYIPKKKTIILPAIDDTQVPCIKFRDAYFYDSSYMGWHKLDNHDDIFGMYVHTFRALVPPEKYFKEHPEYFSKVKFGRISDGQLCLTNLEVFTIVVDELRHRMKMNPEKKYWSVSQNDTFSPCECDSCRAIDEREGSPSGSLIAFVNRVAGEFPDKTISTLAYQYTRAAPKYIKPRSNVNIMLCSIECNRSKPLENDLSSASFIKDVNDWTKLTNNIYLWDYVVDFRNYFCPFPNLRVLQPNIQFFAKNGITDVFEQGSGRSRSEFKELRTYVLAKLLWNPDISVDSVINDFLHGYYEKAAPFLREYIDKMHDALETSGEELWIYGYPLPSQNGYLSGNNLDEYRRLFNKAERAVRNNPEVLQRVYEAFLPIQFTLLEQSKVYGSGKRGFFEKTSKGNWRVKPAMDRLLETFVTRCKRFGFNSLDETGITPDTYYKSTKRFLTVSMKNHLARSKPVVLQIPASMKYHKGEKSALTNGLKGWEDYHMNWLGFEGENMEAIIDLEKTVIVRKINTDFLQDINSWVFLPLDVEFAVSEDGINFTSVKVIKNETPAQKAGAFMESFDASFAPMKARYVRVRATNMKVCPDWHKGAGGLAWIFADEIIVD